MKEVQRGKDNVPIGETGDSIRAEILVRNKPQEQVTRFQF